MSLLLDALQRASQEKEKLAEARASADKPSQATEPAPPEPLPPLAIDFAPSAPSSESLANPDSSPASGTASTRSGLAAELTTAPAELTLDPMEHLTKERSPASGIPELAQSVSDISAGPAAAAPEINPDRLRDYAPQSVAVRREPSVPADSPVGEAKPASPAAPVHPSPVVSPQVAREILGATAKTSKGAPNRQLMALGVLALLIVAANAAFFLGFLDKFLGISNSGLTPVVPPAPKAAPSLPPPAPVRAPALEGQGGSESRAPKDTKADVGEAASSPVVTRMTNAAPRSTLRQNDIPVSAPIAEARAAAGSAPAAKSASRAAGAKAATPVFVAKPAAVSALDTAYAALTEGRFDDAAEAYDRALQKNSGERDALLGLAYIAQRQGNRDEARAYYQQVLRQEPGHPGASAGLLSLSAESDLQMTVSRAREMAERNPDSAIVLSTLGGILAKEGRIAEAQQAYFKALTLEPDNALHAYNLAVALDRLHKYAQAQAYYQRALGLAEKSGAGERSDFPRKEALQRVEQLSRAGRDVPLSSLPESGAR
ncbi:MAG: tetratricopeptide repeat protein [Rhodocyclales bacterium]|nr:tetratricopeptide repeat protein [Rhodocyclales bacterium]